MSAKFDAPPVRTAFFNTGEAKDGTPCWSWKKWFQDISPKLTAPVSNEPPATADATAVAGQIAFDANFVYVAVATDTWKRAALSTF